jgi:D-beta-D-heptose 7-phosphate kinase/D-beta-D-heptose 1-phosphate adenosyltransferase
MKKIIVKKIIVIGDAMRDIDIHGSSTRLSPEAPIPVVDVPHDKESIKKLGGAINVALQIAKAGFGCIFAYKTYKDNIRDIQDEDHEDLAIQIQSYGIQICELNTKERHFVTRKTRIWSNGQQITRIDCEHRIPPNLEMQNKWINDLTIAINDAKVVVFSDYDKGTLTNHIIESIATYCAKYNIPVILDPKRPNFHKIKNLTIVKPNEKELKATGLSVSECSKKMGNTYVINTLAENGIVVYQNGDKILEQSIDGSEVKDVVGCGDNVCSMLAICQYKDLPLEVAIIAANKAASSFGVKHTGSYILSKGEVNNCIDYAIGKTDGKKKNMGS